MKNLIIFLSIICTCWLVALGIRAADGLVQVRGGNTQVSDTIPSSSLPSGILTNVWQGGVQIGGTAAPTSGLSVSNSANASGVQIGTNGNIQMSGQINGSGIIVDVANGSIRGSGADLRIFGGNFFQLAGTAVGLGKAGSPWASNIVSGIVTATNGFASYSTDAAVDGGSGGYTNALGKVAICEVDGIGLTYTIYNNAGTAMYTNPATVIHAEVLLQNGGKVLVTAGTGVTTRARPF